MYILVKEKRDENCSHFFHFCNGGPGDKQKLFVPSKEAGAQNQPIDNTKSEGTRRGDDKGAKTEIEKIGRNGKFGEGKKGLENSNPKITGSRAPETQI